MPSNDSIRALLVPCGCEPRLVEVADSLDGLRRAISADRIEFCFSEPSSVTEGVEVAMVVDEEGKIDGRSLPNRAVRGEAGVGGGEGELLDVAFGDFLVVATDMATGENVDLAHEDLDRWARRFHDPDSGMVATLDILSRGSGGGTSRRAPARLDAASDVPSGDLGASGVLSKARSAGIGTGVPSAPHGRTIR